MLVESQISLLALDRLSVAVHLTEEMASETDVRHMSVKFLPCDAVDTPFTQSCRISFCPALSSV